MLNDWDGSGLYVPYVDGAKSDAFYVVSADHNTKTITLAGAKAPAVTPTEPSPSDEVKTLIGALPEDITFNDKADVEAARTAYDALDETEKAKIDAETLQKLTDAEDALNAPVLLGDVDGVS